MRRLDSESSKKTHLVVRLEPANADQTVTRTSNREKLQGFRDSFLKQATPASQSKDRLKVRLASAANRSLVGFDVHARSQPVSTGRVR